MNKTELLKLVDSLNMPKTEYEKGYEDGFTDGFSFCQKIQWKKNCRRRRPDA